MSLTAASPAAGEMVVSSTTSHLSVTGHDVDEDDVSDDLGREREEEMLAFAPTPSSSSSSSSSGRTNRSQPHLIRQDTPPDIDSTTNDPVAEAVVRINFSVQPASNSSTDSPPADESVHQQHQHQLSQDSGPSQPFPMGQHQGPQQHQVPAFYDHRSQEVHEADLVDDPIYHLDQGNSANGGHSSHYESNSNQLYISSNNSHHSHHVHVTQPLANCHNHNQHIVRMFHNLDPVELTGTSASSHEPVGHIPLHPEPEMGHHSVWQAQHSSSQQHQLPQVVYQADDLHLHENSYAEFQQVLARTARSHSMDEEADAEIERQSVDHRNQQHHSHQYLLNDAVAQELHLSHQQQQQQQQQTQSAHEVEEEEQEIVIADVPVESRARASLPSAYLFIDMVLDDHVNAYSQRDLIDSVVYGVFARKTIPERTQFGPVEGVITQISGNAFKNYMYNHHPNQRNLIVFISECLILDQSDENKSNWMRFVRAADSSTTQNLILVTKEQTHPNPENSQELITTTKFYFMTTKCINPREELRVWYSKDYADRFRLKLLTDEQDEVSDLESCSQLHPPSDPRFNPSTSSTFYRSTSSAPPSISPCDPVNLQIRVPVMDSSLNPNSIHHSHHQQQHHLNEAHVIPLHQEASNQHFSHSLIRSPNESDGTGNLDQALPLDLNVMHSQSQQPSVVTMSNSLSSSSSASFAPIAVVESAKATSPVPSFLNNNNPSNFCDQQSSISSNPTHSKEVQQQLPPASGHKLRNKIAKSQQQQQQMQQQQQERKARDKDGTSMDQKVSEDCNQLQSSTGKTGKSIQQHKCEICGKTFPRFYSLRRHQIMHSGEKKYKCPICSMSFSHVYNRNRHVKRHANRSNGLMRRAAATQKDSQLGDQDPDHPNIRTFGTTDANALNQVVAAGTIISTDLSERKENDPLFGQHPNQGSETGSKPVDSNQGKSFRCSHCYKYFSSSDRLAKHLVVHSGDEEKKPLACHICFKRFLNNSALTCHLKVHSDSRDVPKKYDCVLCKAEFECTQSRKEHVVTHADPVTGKYNCTHCKKKFDEFANVRKHIRAFHSDKQYPCDTCHKVFPRPDKLKLHMLRHSDHREFLCQACGKQFKRKDKLKEHIQRMHAPDREERIAAKTMARQSQAAAAAAAAAAVAAVTRLPPQMVNFQLLSEHSDDTDCSSTGLTSSTSSGVNAGQSSSSGGKKSVTPKVSPNDYHRFIYKCHSCMLGFKRRGMLVNHLAKRHPDLPPEAVPELNLPILKTTRDYYCQYCDKIYKSSSKRKAHILKNHPGKSLPLSNRHKGGVPAIPGIPNPTYSAPVGSITTHPHYCNWCHKQYASKAKLLQHQRKKHPDCMPVKTTAAPINSSSRSCSRDGYVATGEHAIEKNCSNDNSVSATSGISQFEEQQHPTNGYNLMQTTASGDVFPVPVSGANLITLLTCNYGLSSFRAASDGGDSEPASQLPDLLQQQSETHSQSNDLLTQAMSELTGSQSVDQRQLRPDGRNSVVASVCPEPVRGQQQSSPLLVPVSDMSWT